MANGLRKAVVVGGLACALAATATALAQNAPGPHTPPPGVDPAAFKPLPERGDVLAWKLLARVKLVKQKDRYVPNFARDVAALNKKDVKVQGFMLPLEMGEKQTHFVLSALPQTCSFCMPGGPESFVEVRTKKPVKYTFEPVVVSGTLEVLRDDPTGVFYRIRNATPVD